MPHSTKHTAIFSATVLTVSIEPEIAETLLDAMEALHWQVNAAHFDAYVSAARRPSIASQADFDETYIAFINFDRNQQEAVESTRYLQQMFSGRITTIAISASDDPQTLLLAMRAGCTEFLHEPLVEGALQELFDRLNTSWAPADTTRSVGNVLSLFGAKGGVGTTTVAIHLAMYLAQIHKKRTLLLDNQPELGHVCIYLGLESSQYTFREVIRNVHRLDSELLRSVTAKHSSGLEVLSSPDNCEDMNVVDGQAMTRTLEFLRSEYDYVIVDGALTSDEATKAVVEFSNKVYLIATPDIGSVRDLARQVDRLSRSEETSGKLQLVMNRFSSPAAVTPAQIQKVVKLPMAFTLPSSYPDLVHADNLGKPISPESKSAFAVELVRWAGSLTDTPKSTASPQKKKSLFSGLRLALPNIQINRRVNNAT